MVVVVQAIGAQIMAQESVIVTHLGALQEIASMTVRQAGSNHNVPKLSS